jgi:hypothetical protein
VFDEFGEGTKTESVTDGDGLGAGLSTSLAFGSVSCWEKVIELHSGMSKLSHSGNSSRISESSIGGEIEGEALCSRM